MDVRIVGIPVIDGDPVWLRTKVTLCIVHEPTGKGSEIGHLCGVLRRHCEAEMMPRLGMLLHQAVRGFSLWFGKRPTVSAGLRALVEVDLTRA
jgi:hypothetical protein